MDTYKFTLTAATSSQHPLPGVKGNFIRYKKVTNGAADSTIKVRTDNGDTLVMDPNDKAHLPRTFNKLEIYNYNGTEAIEGMLVIGEGDFDSSQITGTVTIGGPKLGDNADDLASSGASSLVGTIAKLMAFDGTTWDRLRAVTVDSVISLATVCAGTLGRLAQAVIGGVNTLQVTERGFTYGANYVSGTTLAANTATTVFSAASNTNGAIVWLAQFYTQNASGFGMAGYLAKTSAPASATDGDCIVSGDNASTVSSTQFAYAGKLARPVFIPSGKGLYFLAQIAESAANRSVSYTLL